MATTVWNFEGGSNGAGASPATTGARTVNAGGSPATLTHASDAALSGAVGVKGVSNTTAISIVAFDGGTGATGTTTFTPDDTMEFRIPYYLDPAGPAVTDSTIIQFYGDGGATPVTSTIGRLRVSPSGACTFTDVATVHTGTVNANISALFGTYVTWQFLLNTGTTTANGSVTVRLLNAAGTQVGSDFTAANYNLGAGDPITAFAIGLLTIQTSSRTWKTDYPQAKDASTSFSLAAPPAASPPTADAGVDQDVQAGATVTLTGAGSTAGSGSITNYSWATDEVPAGAATAALSSTTAASPTFPIASNVSGRYVFTLTVTQTGGLTDTDTVTIWVYPQSGGTGLVYATTGVDIWTNEGGAASKVAAVNDTSNSTFVQGDGTTASQKFIMCPVAPNMQFEVVAQDTASGKTGHFRLYKADGTTQIYVTTWTLPTATAAQTITPDSTAHAAVPTQAEKRALVVELWET